MRVSLKCAWRKTERACRGLPPPFGPPASLRREAQAAAQTAAPQGDPHRGTRAGLGLCQGWPCLPLWPDGVRALNFRGQNITNCLHASKLQVYIMDIMCHVPFVQRLAVCSTPFCLNFSQFVRVTNLHSPRQIVTPSPISQGLPCVSMRACALGVRALPLFAVFRTPSPCLARIR